MAEDKTKIGWMYDGVKGSTSREDYLLGKRVCPSYTNAFIFALILQIDKNFVQYSDVIKKDEDEEAQSRLFNRPGPSDEAAPMPLLMIRQEDPLAALKVCCFKPFVQSS